MLLLCLLFLTQMFTDGASFRFLMKYISNIPLAVEMCIRDRDVIMDKSYKKPLLLITFGVILSLIHI